MNQWGTQREVRRAYSSYASTVLARRTTKQSSYLNLTVEVMGPKHKREVLRKHLPQRYLNHIPNHTTV